MQHPSMQSPPIRLPSFGLGFTRSLAGAMWKSRACALCFSSRVSGDCVFSICFNVECLHHARYSGPVEAGSRVAQKTMLRFTWELFAGEASQSCEVHLLCHHAARRGVRPPKEWKNELHLGLGAEALDNLAVAAIQRTRDEFGLSESVMKLDCRPRFTHARARGYVDLCMCVCVCVRSRAWQVHWCQRLCFHFTS